MLNTQEKLVFHQTMQASLEKPFCPKLESKFPTAFSIHIYFARIQALFKILRLHCEQNALQKWRFNAFVASVLK